MSTQPIVPAIQWHEGMLLAPHHFQQLDMRQQHLLGYHLHLLSPFHWGIMDFQCDPVLLASGIVRLLSCDAVMQDGLLVQYRSDRHPQVELDITPYKTFLQEENWYVYLCIPKPLPGESNVLGDLPRYISWDGGDVPDENVGDNALRIPRLIPNLHLILSQHPPARHQSFRACKIGFSEGAFFTLPYVPPCFFISQDTALEEKCKIFTQRIRGKVSYLCQKWQNQTGSVLLSDTAHLIRPLIQILPVLEGQLSTGVLSPYQLYQTLCLVTGQLWSGLRPDQPPPLVPKYDHEDILISLLPLIEHIGSTLESIEQTYTPILFQKEKRFFFLPMDPAYLNIDVFYIGVRNQGSMTDPELEDWMRGAIIATDSSLEAVKTKRITGAPRQTLKPGEIAALLPTRGCVLFQVENTPDFIREGENLNIFNMGDSDEKRPTDIILYFKNRHPLVEEKNG